MAFWSSRSYSDSAGRIMHQMLSESLLPHELLFSNSASLNLVHSRVWVSFLHLSQVLLEPGPETSLGAVILGHSESRRRCHSFPLESFSSGLFFRVSAKCGLPILSGEN